jgi:hypothetical protein
VVPFKADKSEQDKLLKSMQPATFSYPLLETCDRKTVYVATDESVLPDNQVKLTFEFPAVADKFMGAFGRVVNSKKGDGAEPLFFVQEKTTKIKKTMNTFIQYISTV